MIHKTLSIAYRFKNFKSHMGITDHVTLSGMLRRYTRKYPKTFNGIKKGCVLGALYYVMMSFMPGSSLPLQKDIKLSGYSVTRIITKGWFYNIIAPQPQEYLIKLNQLILSALDNQLYDTAFLGKYFAEVQQLVQQEKNQLKPNSYLDLLLYSQIVLQNIIRYQKRLLLQQCIVAHYEWVYCIIMDRLWQTKISQKECKHVKLVYPLIQYILNYASQQSQYKCIHLYYLMTKKDTQHQNSFRHRLMQQAISQSPFKTTLKDIYHRSQSQEVKQQIIHIFQELNHIYQRQGKVATTD